jgi:hypothetical protein
MVAETMLCDEETITLYITENGDDLNEGSRERPLMSISKAVQMIRGKGFKTVELVVSGTIQEPVAPEAMIAFSGRGLPEIILRGESAEKPGILSAEGLYRRVIYIGDGNTIRVLEHLVISGGTTDSDSIGGAGVFVERSTLILEGGRITGNDANFGRGGALYVGRDARLIMRSGSITRNRTMMSGGGVFIDDGGIFKIEGGHISKNRASISGGGVFVGLDSTFEMNGGIIGDNIVGGEEGITIRNVSMTLGEGGGVYVCGGSSFRMDAGEIRNNRVLGMGPEKDAIGYGGGVYVDKEAVFMFYDGSIFQNSALSWGGGICVNGSATMYGGEICSNSARFGGGGINVEADGVCVIKGGVLASNVTGGGGGAAYIMENGEFVFMDGLTINNRAVQAGRVLVIDGKATISGGYIKGFTEAELEKIERKISAEKFAGLPPTDCVICLLETVHLTLSGGEVHGPIGRVKEDQFVDVRDRSRDKRAMRHFTGTQGFSS